jgi:hypothetical protein
VLAYGAGVVAVALLFVHSRPAADRLIAGLLTALWLWLGIVFQGMYATDVDQTLGLVYSAVFVLQAYLFLRHRVMRRRLVFAPTNGIAGWVGWVALGYAIVAYPVIGTLGHGWPESPLLYFDQKFDVIEGPAPAVPLSAPVLNVLSDNSTSGVRTVQLLLTSHEEHRLRTWSSSFPATLSPRPSAVSRSRSTGRRPCDGSRWPPTTSTPTASRSRCRYAARETSRER